MVIEEPYCVQQNLTVVHNLIVIFLYAKYETDTFETCDFILITSDSRKITIRVLATDIDIITVSAVLQCFHCDIAGQEAIYINASDM